MPCTLVFQQETQAQAGKRCSRNVLGGIEDQQSFGAEEKQALTALSG